VAKTTSIPSHVLPLSQARINPACILSTTVVLGNVSAESEQYCRKRAEQSSRVDRDYHWLNRSSPLGGRLNLERHFGATSASTTPARRRPNPVARGYGVTLPRAPARRNPFSPRPVHGGTGEGATSLRQIAAVLNERGITTSRGGEWSAVQVQRLMARQ
jgi:hypothetical protein